MYIHLISGVVWSSMHINVPRVSGGTITTPVTEELVGGPSAVYNYKENNIKLQQLVLQIYYNYQLLNIISILLDSSNPLDLTYRLCSARSSFQPCSQSSMNTFP